MMKPIEQRRGQRISAALWVRLTGSGSGSGTELGMGSLTNASVSGAFLETEIQLPVNANITLEPVSSAGSALEGTKMAARVARVERRGLGIEWRVVATPELLARLAAARI
jgi:hypothetical protein